MFRYDAPLLAIPHPTPPLPPAPPPPPPGVIRRSMATRGKDFKEAEAHYNEALRINPRAAFAHNSLGHLLHHRHKVGKPNSAEHTAQYEWIFS